MIEKTFKVLMHMGEYVDSNRLYDGIYPTATPRLYSKDVTIESLVEQGRIMKDMTLQSFIQETYFENLMLCELVIVNLTGI
jgi:hypothetical protein